MFWHLKPGHDKRQEINSDKGIVEEAVRLCEQGHRVVLLINPFRNEALCRSGARNQNPNLLYLRTTLHMVLDSWLGEPGFGPTNIAAYPWEQIVNLVIADMNLLRLEYEKSFQNLFHVELVDLRMSEVAFKAERTDGVVYIYRPAASHSDKVHPHGSFYIWFIAKGNKVRIYMGGLVISQNTKPHTLEITGEYRIDNVFVDPFGKIREPKLGECVGEQNTFHAILKPFP